MDADSKHEVLEFQVVELLEDGDAAFEKEIAALTENSSAVMLQPTRSLAFIKFILCHSLPTINENNACWTYATLKNSHGTVENQLLDLNHQMADNMPILMGRISPSAPDRIIGHMLSAEIDETPDDPMIPTKPVPIIVRGVIYKRTKAGRDIIDQLKRGKTVKVSMECEYDEIGYYYDGKLYDRNDNPNLDMAIQCGKKELAGKKIARVLGGVSPDGGIVNFHGAAILLNEQPADPAAQIQSAVATKVQTEIGGTEMAEDKINEILIEADSVEPAIEGVSETAERMTPPTFEGPETELSLEALQKGQAEQQEAIVKNERLLERLLNSIAKFMGTDKAADTTNQVVDAPRSVDNDHDASPMLDVQPTQNVELDPNTPYADPGYMPDKLPRFPLSSDEEVSAAAHHFNKVENLSPYTPMQCSLIQERILKAAGALNMTLPLTVKVTASVDTSGTEATQRTAKEVNTMENQTQNAAGATENTENAAASKQEHLDRMSKENEMLHSTIAEMKKHLDDLRSEKDARDRSDRATARKGLMQKTCNMDDEMASALHGELHDMDDDQFSKFHSKAKMMFDHGKKTAMAIISNNGGSMDADAIIAPNSSRVDDAIISDNGAGMKAAAGKDAPGQSDFLSTQGEETPMTKPGIITTDGPGGKPSHPSQDEIKNTKGEPTPEDKAEPKHSYVEGATAPRVPYAPVQHRNPKSNPFYGM